MSEPTRPGSARHGSPTIEALRFILVTLGAIVLLASLTTPVFIIFRSAGPLPDSVSLDIIMVIAAGLTACGILWSLTAILVLLEQQSRHAARSAYALDHLQPSLLALSDLAENLSAPPATAPAAAAPGLPPPPSPLQTSPSATSELTRLLHQIYDLMLMTEQQRQQHAQELSARRAAQLQADFAAAQEEVRHSMSISAWDHAANSVARFQQKYPGTPQTTELDAELRRERAAMEKEHTDRLFADVAQASNYREWARAVRIAEEIQKRFPHDRRSEKLRSDLAILRENAAAQERKEQEELFKDLLKRQRYEEALDIARTLIEKYPLSPTAAELNRLLPKVHEIVREQQASRAPPTF